MFRNYLILFIVAVALGLLGCPGNGGPSDSEIKVLDARGREVSDSTFLGRGEELWECCQKACSGLDQCGGKMCICAPKAQARPLSGSKHSAGCRAVCRDW